MGPEATVELLYKIIKSTPAKKDQDHIHVIMDNNPKIADRTMAILNNKTSPLPEMVKTAKNIEKAGADFIIIPCNAAHHYYENLKKEIGIPVLNMIELTALAINECFPKVKKVGIIATTGTIKTKMYDTLLERIGIKAIYPSKLQHMVMKAIYNNIKRGRIKEGREIIVKVAEYLTERGSEAIISACTEVSLVLKNVTLALPIIDPLQILAEVAVKTALGNSMIKISCSNIPSGSMFLGENEGA